MDEYRSIDLIESKVLISKSTLNSVSFIDFCHAKYDEECQIVSLLDQKAGAISAIFLAGITLFISEYSTIEYTIFLFFKSCGKSFGCITNCYKCLILIFLLIGFILSLLVQVIRKYPTRSPLKINDDVKKDEYKINELIVIQYLRITDDMIHMRKIKSKYLIYAMFFGAIIILMLFIPLICVRIC